MFLCAVSSSEIETGIQLFFSLQDVAEILANLSSGSWADRKDGLISLQAMLRSGAPCLK